MAAQSFLSERVRRQPPNPFGPLVPLMRDSANSVLSQGVPPTELFPLTAINVTLADGTTVALSAEDVVSAQRCALQ
jgi:hypothetical protein